MPSTGERAGPPAEAAAARAAASGPTARGAASADPAAGDPAAGDSAPSRQTASTAKPASAAAPEIDSDPDQLLGLAPAGIARLLGKPGLIRRDGPAEVWQYRAASCILDVFLFGSNGDLKVTYFELRGRGAARRSRRECFAGMLVGGNARHTG